MNLQRVEEGVDSFDLGETKAAPAHHGVLRLIAAVDAAPRSLRFRMRARVGKHRPWHSELDGQE